MHIRRYAAWLVLGLFWAAAAQSVPLWELQGTRGTVHIAGSIHFLRERDYPLPARFMEVYERANVVVFELDLSKLDVLETQSLLQQLAIDPRGKSLQEYLGAQNWRNATTMAARVDIDLAALRGYEPWFAALQVTQLRLAQLGFDGSFGIETQLTLQAVADGKQLRGLESLEQQFGALDTLPIPAQREFLLQTLEDAADIGDGLARIVRAWRAGDTRTLESELLDSMRDQPELYERILVSRNRDWTRQIGQLAAGDDRVLVVVGALHLVGEDSVIRMLEDAGYRARQIR